ncbi:MAG TPA: PspC domain-containing protein [Streptosporangiaceae bacterium]|jgi:phage shock protein PspC (stress-responsive transcriptional regulator)
MNEANGNKRLIRTRKGRLVAGVCSGIGEYAGIDPTVVRLIFAVLTLVTAGVFALVYLAAWVVIPEEGESASIAENLIKKTGSS